jgi:hypothetical protein
MIARIRLPKTLVAVWWAAFIAGGALFLELLWEQTFLTWNRGPQMIGFSLWHVYPFFALVGFGGYVLMLVWLVLTAVFLARRRAMPVPTQMPYVALPLIAIALAYFPYSFWARLGGVQV